MKKQGKAKKQTVKKARKNAQSTSRETVDEGRRNVSKIIRNSAIGLAVLGGVGGVIAYNVRNTFVEHDLDRVAKGKPSIVQIHDPQCQLCLALQQETKQALKGFADDIEYIVANIRTQKGRRFARQYGVPHVTLLLFDGKGELQQVLQGTRGRDELEDAFRSLVGS